MGIFDIFKKNDLDRYRDSEIDQKNRKDFLKMVQKGDLRGVKKSIKKVGDNIFYETRDKFFNRNVLLWSLYYNRIEIFNYFWDRFVDKEDMKRSNILFEKDNIDFNILTALLMLHRKEFNKDEKNIVIFNENEFDINSKEGFFNYKMEVFYKFFILSENYFENDAIRYLDIYNKRVIYRELIDLIVDYFKKSSDQLLQIEKIRYRGEITVFRDIIMIFFSSNIYKNDEMFRDIFDLIDGGKWDKIINFDHSIFYKKDKDGRDLIQYSLMKKNSEGVKYFLKYLTPNIDKYKKGWLHYCVDNDNIDIWRSLIEKGGRSLLNLRDNKNRTVIMDLIDQKNVKVLEYIYNEVIDNSFNIDPFWKDGKTVLHYCGRYCNHVDTVYLIFKILLKQDPNLVFIRGKKDNYTALTDGIDRRNLKICGYLIYWGLDPDDNDKDISFKRGIRDQISSFVKNRDNFLSELKKISNLKDCGKKIDKLKEIENNLNILTVDIYFYYKDKYTKKNNFYNLLHRYSEKGDIEIVKYLIKKGAKIDEIDNYGDTALMAAAQNIHYNIVEFLIKNGAKIDEKSNNGWSALMLAAQNGHYNIVELLIDNGADVTIRNNNDATAYSLAKRLGKDDIAKLLETYIVRDLIKNNKNIPKLKTFDPKFLK